MPAALASVEFAKRRQAGFGWARSADRSLGRQWRGDSRAAGRSATLPPKWPSRTTRPASWPATGWARCGCRTWPTASSWPRCRPIRPRWKCWCKPRRRGHGGRGRSGQEGGRRAGGRRSRGGRKGQGPQGRRRRRRRRPGGAAKPGRPKRPPSTRRNRRRPSAGEASHLATTSATARSKMKHIALVRRCAFG